MTTMTASPAVNRINEQLSITARKVAMHVPSNHKYEVILEIPGAGVDLRDMEGRERIEPWAAWMDGEIWRKLA